MVYETVILVDDNPTTLFYNQDVVLDLMPQAKIISYEDPNEFLKDYATTHNNNSEPVLLLLDINMPQKLGYELLDEMEELYGSDDNLHVIMVTSSNLRIDIEKSSRFVNVIGYIEKPLTVEKINKALNGDYQVG